MNNHPKSIYTIIEDFLQNKQVYDTKPIKPNPKIVKKVMSGAPGRISFVLTTIKTQVKPKYNPADWPQEEDLPVRR
jgi:hypothetical protein